MKKGQVTIFIIIAILIIAVTAISFIPRDNIKNDEIPQSIEPVYINLISCLEETTKEGTYFIAAHGGYYNVPFNSSIVYFTEDIPYYYLEKNKIVPKIDDIEKELGDYISGNLKNCIDFEIYTFQGFSISIKEYSTLISMTETEIKIKMENPITISKENDTNIIKNIETNIENNLNNLYYASLEVVESYSQKPGFVCLTCMDEISNKYSVNINLMPVNDVSVFENDIIWYFITNKDDTSYDKLKWVFIVEK